MPYVQEECTICTGSGKKPCPDCGGRGKCPWCRGSGRQAAADAACGGTGIINGRSHLACGGTGHLPCDYCAGTGNCKSCSGTGKVSCDSCDGSGTVAVWQPDPPVAEQAAPPLDSLWQSETQSDSWGNTIATEPSTDWQSEQQLVEPSTGWESGGESNQQVAWQPPAPNPWDSPASSGGGWQTTPTETESSNPYSPSSEPEKDSSES